MTFAEKTTVRILLLLAEFFAPTGMKWDIRTLRREIFEAPATHPEGDPAALARARTATTRSPTVTP